MDILIATKNEYKAGELLHYLEGLENVKTHLLKEQNIEIDVVEDGESLEENAKKKAVEISKKTNFLTLASDGGVDIPALGDNWDILKNQRFVGEDKSDLEKAETVLKIMKDLKGEDRKVLFFHALALAKKGSFVWSDVDITEEGYVVENLPDGEIPKHKWFSQIWYYPKYGKVFNELSEDELKEVRKQSSSLKESLHRQLTSLENSPYF